MTQTVGKKIYGKIPLTNDQKYSDYIVYVDESGDHDLTKINRDYPIFTLVFCVFKTDYYIHKLMPNFNVFKVKYWGHCDTILHEHDIRKNMHGDWKIMSDPQTRKSFQNNITTLIQGADFDIISCVIRKEFFINRSMNTVESPDNPYEIALYRCMQRLNRWLMTKNQGGKTVHIQFEKRGKKEDNQLKQVFCTNYLDNEHADISYKIGFLDKKSNAIGLQVADLVARPIGIKILRPEQKNRSFDIIKNKFAKDNNRNIGLIISP